MNGGPDSVLVLAGSRGVADPLAQHAGVSHKCLIPVGGLAMIKRVLGTLRSLPQRPRIIVAVDRPEIRVAVADEDLQLIAAAGSPSHTVLSALADRRLSPPFLVTTADHPLLTEEMIVQFWRRVPDGTDAAVAVASASAIREAWPDARRTYLEFSDGGYSGCNLFAVMTARAQRAIEFWRRVEINRKRPMAMVRLLGVSATLRFALGRLSLEEAVISLSRLTGTRLAAITLPFPEAAVDVDKPEDLALAQRILDLRHAASPVAQTADGAR